MQIQHSLCLGSTDSCPACFATSWADKEPSRWSSGKFAVTSAESCEGTVPSSQVAMACEGPGLRSGFKALVRQLRLLLWVLASSFVMWGQQGHLVAVRQMCFCKVRGRGARTHQVLGLHMLSVWSCHVSNLCLLERQPTLESGYHKAKLFEGSLGVTVSLLCSASIPLDPCFCFIASMYNV